MATTLLKPAGTGLVRLNKSPHANTVPSARNARLCQMPAAMAAMFVAAGGLFVICPSVVLPHITMSPARVSAMLCRPPAATATTSARFVGTTHWL
jgi:hypothetical protein